MSSDKGKVFKIIFVVIAIIAVLSLIARLFFRKDEYKITFDVGEYGYEIKPVKVKKGEKLKKLPVPECKYRTVVMDDNFDPLGDYDGEWYGFYGDDIEFTLFNDVPMTFFKQYREVEPITGTEYSDDYTFVGWYLNGELITENNIKAYNKNITLVAHWVSNWSIPVRLREAGILFDENWTADNQFN